ncbi:MAG: ribosome maturation factor RimP [Acidimicrobiales bacterium]|nr:ribosome maturation factor RimP [Acidimicrobiales bacterium]
MDAVEKFRALVLPEVETHGVDLYDLEMQGGTLRVTVDRDGGVDLETIGSLTRAISRLIDEHDPIAGSFTLEVSSPGLERTLRTPEHFGRAVGEKVSIKTRPDVEGDRRFTGTVESADADGATFLTDGVARHLRYDQIDKARTVFEWGPTPKPGKGRPSNSKISEKKAAKR